MPSQQQHRNLPKIQEEEGEEELAQDMGTYRRRNVELYILKIPVFHQANHEVIHLKPEDQQTFYLQHCQGVMCDRVPFV